MSNANTASTCHRDKTKSINFESTSKQNRDEGSASKSFARNLTLEMASATDYRREGVALQNEEEYFKPEINRLKMICLNGEELPPFDFNRLDLDYEEILPLSNFVSERSTLFDSYSFDDFSPLGDSIISFSSMY